MSSNENISVTKGHVYLFALLCDRRRPSLYEQQRDTFIGQAMTEIWAFQKIVFGLGDSSDSSTILTENKHDKRDWYTWASVSASTCSLQRACSVS